MYKGLFYIIHDVRENRAIEGIEEENNGNLGRDGIAGGIFGDYIIVTAYKPVLSTPQVVPCLFTELL